MGKESHHMQNDICKSLLFRICVVLLLVTTLRLFAQEVHVGPVTDLVIVENLIYSCSQGGVFVQKDGRENLVYRPHFRVISLASFDGSNLLLLVGGQPGISGEIGLLDLETKHFETLEIAKDLIYSVDATGDQAAMACADGRVLITSFAKPILHSKPSLSEASINILHKHTSVARAVQFSPDGKWLASVGLDGIVMLSAVTPHLLSAAGKTMRKEANPPIILQDHSAKVECLVFSPDSKLLASGARDGKIRIHTIGGRLVRTYTGLGTEVTDAEDFGQNPYIWALAWGGEPQALIAGSAKGTLYQLALTDNRWERMKWPHDGPIYSLVFDAMGKLHVGTEKVTQLPTLFADD
ncbi:hypothetical protein IH992_34465 [Candidatus Poribacteria bacterium]|nr:hypothetical protein [Candidatus Poribacteria bacterium]